MLIEFQNVRLYQKFFDGYSGEYFIKSSDNDAIMISGISDDEENIKDTFKPDEIVELISGITEI